MKNKTYAVLIICLVAMLGLSIFFIMRAYNAISSDPTTPSVVETPIPVFTSISLPDCEIGEVVHMCQCRGKQRRAGQYFICLDQKG